jgi:hypothetical protein
MLDSGSGLSGPSPTSPQPGCPQTLGSLGGTGKVRCSHQLGSKGSVQKYIIVNRTCTSTRASARLRWTRRSERQRPSSTKRTRLLAIGDQLRFDAGAHSTTRLLGC